LGFHGAATKNTENRGHLSNYGEWGGIQDEHLPRGYSTRHLQTRKSNCIRRVTATAATNGADPRKKFF
jgi:hypothetical protein